MRILAVFSFLFRLPIIVTPQIRKRQQGSALHSCHPQSLLLQSRTSDTPSSLDAGLIAANVLPSSRVSYPSSLPPLVLFASYLHDTQVTFSAIDALTAERDELLSR